MEDDERMSGDDRTVREWVDPEGEAYQMLVPAQGIFEAEKVVGKVSLTMMTKDGPWLVLLPSEARHVAMAILRMCDELDPRESSDGVGTVETCV